MSGNDNVEAMVGSNLKELSQVGEARSSALKEAGYESMYDVSQASVDELADVLSNAGEKTAMRIKGSAQGHCKKLEAWQWVGQDVELVEVDSENESAEAEEQEQVEEDEDEVAKDGAQTRVVLLTGDGVWEDRKPSDVDSILENVFRRFSTIDPDAIGLPGDRSQEVSLIDDWLMRKRAHNDEWAERDVFKFGVEEHIPSEGYKEANPDDPSDDTMEIDYDTMRDLGLWRDAFEARDKQMMRWATHAIVVEDGDYAKSPIYRVDELERPIVKEFVPGDDSWKDDDDDDDQDGERGTVADEATNERAEERTADESGWTDYNQYDGSADEYQYEGGRPGDPTLM